VRVCEQCARFFVLSVMWCELTKNNYQEKAVCTCTVLYETCTGNVQALKQIVNISFGQTGAYLEIGHCIGVHRTPEYAVVKEEVEELWFVRIDELGVAHLEQIVVFRSPQLAPR